MGVFLCHRNIRIYFQNNSVKQRDVTIFTLQGADAHRRWSQKFPIILGIQSETSYTASFKKHTRVIL